MIDGGGGSSSSSNSGRGSSSSPTLGSKTSPQHWRRRTYFANASVDSSCLPTSIETV